jgi:steroid delta-isomerase-like uncharacterized protein
VIFVVPKSRRKTLDTRYLVIHADIHSLVRRRTEPSHAQSEEYPMSSGLLSDIATALESLDAERLIAHYVEDAIFEDPAARQVVKGHDELRAYFTELFSLPAVQFEVESIFGSGAWAAVEWIWRGLSRQSHEPFAIRGAPIFELSAGLIRRETIYYDSAAWDA